jgi:hypothetical protein
MKLRVPNAPRNDGLRVLRTYPALCLARRYGIPLHRSAMIAELAGFGRSGAD